MRKIAIHLFLWCLCLIAAGSTSDADEFSSVAAGCVPDPVNIQANNYLITAGSVKHQPNMLGDIHLRCPISIIISKPTQIYMIASSDDVGVLNQKTFVTVKLNAKSNFDDGAFDAICSAHTDQASQDGTVHFIESPCSLSDDTWNQTRFAWYLEVMIHRRSTSHIAVFYGVGVH